MNKIDVRGFMVEFEGKVYKALSAYFTEGEYRRDYLDIYAINESGTLVVLHGYPTQFKFSMMLDELF